MTNRLVVNLVSNTGFFACNTLIALWFVPYLIHNLGIGVYGLVPLALTITSYFTLLTIGLNTAVSRSMTMALGMPDQNQTIRIFNSSFWAMAVLAACLLPIGILASFFISHWINVPPGQEAEVRWLFMFTVFAFFFTTTGSSFNLISYCRNRFDLQNIGNSLGLLARIAIVVALFHWVGPALWQVGLGFAAAALVIMVFSIYICRRLAPQLNIHIKHFHGLTLRQLGSTGSWIFINQIGSVLLVSTDLLVCNKLFGADASGRYASVLQWPLLLRNFAIVVAGIFGPTIIALYGRRQDSELVRYAQKAVKFMGLLVALPVGLICGLAGPLLRVWLGPGFESLALVMMIMVSHLWLNLMYLPLHHVPIAANRVKWPGISQIVAGILNLALAIILGKLFFLKGIALAAAIVFITRNLVFTPFYAAHVLKKPRGTFLRDILPVFGLFLLTGASGWGVSVFWTIDSWPDLMACGAVISAFYLLICWKWVLNQSEKETFSCWLEKIFLHKNREVNLAERGS